MKEIGVENIKHFQEFLFFLAFRDSNNEISRSLLNTHMTKVVLGFRLSSVCVLLLHFFFFPCVLLQGIIITVHALFTYCSWDPQPLYSEKNIKNGFHNTITHLMGSTLFLIRLISTESFDWVPTSSSRETHLIFLTNNNQKSCFNFRFICRNK